MLSEGPRITILVTGDCRSSVNGSRLMLSWTISICISNTVSSHLHYYSRSKTAYLKSISRGGVTLRLLWLDVVATSTISRLFFCNLSLSYRWWSESLLLNIRNTSLLVAEATAWKVFPPHCSSVTTYIVAEDLFGFTFKSKKMTHFNKGPAYGLSAEVRSKVSVPAPSAPFVSRRKNILQTLSKLAKVYLTYLVQIAHSPIDQSKAPNTRLFIEVAALQRSLHKLSEVFRMSSFQFAVIWNQDENALLLVKKQNKTRFL